MNCRLCLNERELCDSHIIPEFLYRPGYDDKHRMVNLRKIDPQFRYIQKGLREPLLCKECEALLNDRYEKYFKLLWYDKKTLPSTAVPHSAFVVKGIDYARFKLFLLSILWRASVSSLEAFKMVSLGEHEEKIRRMLWEFSAGVPGQYQIIGALLLSPGTTSVLGDLIAAPTVEEHNSFPIAMFLFGGCVWCYTLSDKPSYRIDSLTHAGMLQMPVHDLRDVKPFVSFFTEENVKRATQALDAHETKGK